MAIVTTSNFPSPIERSFGYKMLSTPTPNFIHNIPAMKKKLPRNGGKTLRMMRYNTLGSAIVPLGNSGVTPPGKLLQAAFVDATPQWYGTYVEINEQVTLQAQDPVLNQTAIRLGVSLRQTQDELMRNMLAADATSIDCTHGGVVDVPTEVSYADINEVVALLLDNDAMMILDGIDGEDKFNTTPVRDAYFAMSHTALVPTWNSLDQFISKNAYPSPRDALRSEWGTIGNIRVLISSIGSIDEDRSMNGNIVYNIFIQGQEATGCVEQDGASAQFIYRPPIYSGPLAQNATAAWKMAESPVILNESWVFKLRSIAIP